MSLLVGQCLEVVHLMKKKINLIITEEKLCKKLKKRAMKIFNYEKMEMISSLTKEENKSYKELFCG